MKRIIIIVSIWSLVGCATTSNISQVKFGMTQENVYELNGEPISKQFDKYNTAWLYRKIGFDILTGPNMRYYWVVFDKDNKVVAVRDKGAEQLESSNSGGMGFLCKKAISDGNQAGIFVHCE